MRRAEGGGGTGGRMGQPELDKPAQRQRVEANSERDREAGEKGGNAQGKRDGRGFGEGGKGAKDKRTQ